MKVISMKTVCVSACIFAYVLITYFMMFLIYLKQSYQIQELQIMNLVDKTFWNSNKLAERIKVSREKVLVVVTYTGISTRNFTQESDSARIEFKIIANDVKQNVDKITKKPVQVYFCSLGQAPILWTDSSWSIVSYDQLKQSFKE